MAVVGVALLVLERTDSAALAGASVAAFTFPSLASGSVLGAMLDRSARPLRLISLDQAVAGTAASALAFAPEGTPDVVLPLLCLTAGVTAPLSYGGVTGLLPEVVPERLLPATNTLEAASFNIAIVAGPALAGTLAAGFGATPAVAAQGVVKFVALVFFVTMPDLVRPATRGALRVVAAVVSGFRHVIGTPALMAVTVAGAISLGGRGVLTLAFPFFATGRLNADESLTGYMWAAFAAGSAVGALALLRIQRRRSAEHVALVGIAVAGTLMLAWPLATSVAASLSLIALAGIAYGPALAATLAVRQERTPKGLRAQISTAAASLKPAFFGLGTLLSAPAVAGLGASGAILVAGGVQLLAALVGAALLRER